MSLGVWIYLLRVFLVIIWQQNKVILFLKIVKNRLVWQCYNVQTRVRNCVLVKLILPQKCTCNLFLDYSKNFKWKSMNRFKRIITCVFNCIAKNNKHTVYFSAPYSFFTLWGTLEPRLSGFYRIRTVLGKQNSGQTEFHELFGNFILFEFDNMMNYLVKFKTNWNLIHKKKNFRLWVGI